MGKGTQPDGVRAFFARAEGVKVDKFWVYPLVRPCSGGVMQLQGMKIGCSIEPSVSMPHRAITGYSLTDILPGSQPNALPAQYLDYLTYSQQHSYDYEPISQLRLRYL